MIPLILCILSSSLIFAIFKLFPKFGIDTFQAIVFNYFMAFGCGILFFGKEWNTRALMSGNWMVFVIIAAILFISLFLIMGKSSQKNGVALTSIAVKMSMAISLILMIIVYRESLSLLKISGILLAFTGVFLVSFSKSEEKIEKSSKWMLLVLFIGSGILDFVLNYVQKFELTYLSASLFSAFGFGLAGLIGIFILSIKIIRKETAFSSKNLIAGIILGIPNYFSIYFLMLSYNSTGWNDSTVLAVINVSVVLTSAFIGFLAFKEIITLRKLTGLITAVSAIVILYFANK